MIEQKDTREWYDMIGFLCPETDITVYLPENVYESLILSSKSGTITVPDGFTFGSAGVSALSGDVRFEADTKGLLEAETSSGSLTVRGTEADKMNLGTVSGDLHVDSAARFGTYRLRVKRRNGNIGVGLRKPRRVDHERRYFHV